MNHSANLLLLTFENDIPWIIFAYVLPDAKLQEAEQGIMRSVFRLVNFLSLKLFLRSVGNKTVSCLFPLAVFIVKTLSILTCTFLYVLIFFPAGKTRKWKEQNKRSHMQGWLYISLQKTKTKISLNLVCLFILTSFEKWIYSCYMSKGRYYVWIKSSRFEHHVRFINTQSSFF